MNTCTHARVQPATHARMHVIVHISVLDYKGQSLLYCMIIDQRLSPLLRCRILVTVWWFQIIWGCSNGLFVCVPHDWICDVLWLPADHPQGVQLIYDEWPICKSLVAWDLNIGISTESWSDKSFHVERKINMVSFFFETITEKTGGEGVTFLTSFGRDPQLW